MQKMKKIIFSADINNGTKFFSITYTKVLGLS